MTSAHLAPVVLGLPFPDHPTGARPTKDGLRHHARATIEAVAASGVAHAEFRVCPFDGLDFDDVMQAVHEGADDAITGTRCHVGFVVAAPAALHEAAVADLAEQAARWEHRRVRGFAAVVAGPGHVRAFAIAAKAGLGRCLDGLGDDRSGGGTAGLAEAMHLVSPDRLGSGWRLLEGCAEANGRVVALDPSVAAVRDRGIPLETCPPGHHRRLFDAGFRLTGAPETDGFTVVERSACSERAALATFLPSPQKEVLVAELAEDAARPARLVHLAARDEWEASRGRGAYLPAGWEQDGFIHLSALHQVLTPANRFYRSREDLVAVVVDAHLLGGAVVWEAGTGTLERFPHLYGTLTPDAVLGEVPFSPQPDGGFLLPERLLRALRSPLGG